MPILSDDDTIAAISTAAGEGAIGIVRLSGPQALRIAQDIFVGTYRQLLPDAPGYSLLHGCVTHPHSGKILDEVLLAVMRAPRSYTREDLVEFHCHGGRIVLRDVLALVLEQGARLAESGEFTKRAFLNGRLDLVQAESVIDIIRAKSDAGLQLAVQQLHGKLSSQVKRLRDELQQLLALIEASIDFADEEIEVIEYDRIQEGLQTALDECAHLLASAQEGKIARDGLSVAIAGKPNVGKSSLMNVFLQEERAIVTSIPGTTRDTVEDYITLEGVPIRLIDTAGIRRTDDRLEGLGVARSRQMLQQADLVLCLFDSSSPWEQEDEDFVKLARAEAQAVVFNKIDLPPQLSEQDTLSRFPDGTPAFRISVTQQLGLDELKHALAEHVTARPLESIAVTNVRHTHALQQTVQSLNYAQESTRSGMSQEFIVLDIRNALDHLGEISGETTTEDILNRIFSTFCIGK
ncbi:tRNA uridine-5-carboxymethylaminomethyl(34) synthesis GTPase MnmE [candidate division KSB3 bacterium]|uniref:tRNA modification GTPase MnmE n=1 Tax=candidate division KSB3 bacterium TaxID=2044937 RepID=A0A2G6E2P9_9BACT|nr:MAG: tRNA uridine-5-carboxymethylaminomethyl(34) synthesis GTPase MnmE [candidate division KSB3 bacterium]PIE29256.1 MAG: tRNA uridine-5-carboxymethylaminomethyl(34) synthesis GTPase MnmE [candidate division KSB3 bacterium]